jgi:hypothetical protein
MGRFDRQIETAKRAILKNGEFCTWRVPTAVVDTPPSDTPWKPTSDTPTDYDDISILFLPSSGSLNQLIHFIKGTEVTTGSTKALMASVAFVPSAKDVVIRSSGETLRIKSIDPLAPNGQNILYTIEFDQ